jgi:hypothetical protein
MVTQIILYALSFIVGVSFTYIFFKNMMYSSLKTKYDDLVKEKTPINQDDYDKLKTKYGKLSTEKNKSDNTIDRLKLYLGLVKDNEYGIIKKNLIYGVNNTTIKISAEFKTIQRGANKVKISLNVDSIKTEPNKTSDTKLMNEIKIYMDDWYDIDDSFITWVEPDKVTQREFDIDEVLREK